MSLIKKVFINFIVISAFALVTMIIARQEFQLFPALSFIVTAFLLSFIISLKYIEKVDFFFIVIFFMGFLGFLVLSMNTPILTPFHPHDEEFFLALDEIGYFFENFFRGVSFIAAVSTIFVQKLLMKKIKRPFLGLTLIVSLFLIIPMRDFPYLPIFLRFNYLFITFFFCYILVIINEFGPVVYKYRKITNVLNNDLEPERYLHEMEKFVNNNKYKYPINLEDDKLHKIWLVVAYISSGNLDRALEILSDVNVNLDFNKTKDSILWMHYNYHSCDIYLLKNDFENAEKHYGIMKIYYDIFKSNSRSIRKKTILKDFDDLIFELDTRLHPSKDKYRKVLTYYEKLMNNKKIGLRGKVNVMFKMAIAYENLGMEEERKKCLEYVATNGNKHYRVELAKEILAKLNEINVE